MESVSETRRQGAAGARRLLEFREPRHTPPDSTEGAAAASDSGSLPSAVDIDDDAPAHAAFEDLRREVRHFVQAGRDGHGLQEVERQIGL